MTLPDRLMGEVSDFVAAKLGLNFPPNRWKDLDRALQPLAHEMGFEEFEQFAQWMLGTSLNRQQLEQIASKLTVGETYFFREPQAFSALRDHVVPQLVAARRLQPKPTLRVWSAGCCTGEEAYSLAIFFAHECPELQHWRIRITGTDINPQFLRKAREGIYREWSFRNAPPGLKSRHFSAVGEDRFELCDAIKRMVTFEHLNLADEAYPSLHNGTNGVDLIFCRNVLMYFSPGHVRRAVEGFHRSLAEGGCLVVGICETSPSLAPGFVARPLPGITLYQKSGAAGATAPAATFPRERETPLMDFPRLDLAVIAPPAPPVVTVGAQLAHARTLIEAGDYAGAVTRLETVLAQAPLEVDAATLLARAFANQGNLTAALRAIERALAADKLRAPLHYLQGTIRQELGELELAAVSFEKALYLEPDLVLAHLAAAELARSAGRNEKAERHHRHALRVLRRLRADEAIPEADGLTAGRLIAVIEAMLTAKALL